MPPYDHAYRARQLQRVQGLLSGLAARSAPTRPGRVIPEQGDLPIGSGRRLVATIMFLDICGSSNLGSDRHEEQGSLLTGMSVFFSEMMRIVDDHGGTVEKNTGDGLMAYFAHGDGDHTPQHTAVGAALTMLATGVTLLSPLAIKLGLGRLPFRICLDHGPVTIAELGAPRGFRSIVAIGTTANIASKMLAIAEEDELLIGDAVLAGLPTNWGVHVGEPRNTGWTYMSDRTPYLCRPFTGRWPV